MEDNSDDTTTPSTETPPTEPQNSPPADPPQRDNELLALIGAMQDRMESMENQLKTIIAIKPDSSPVKKPWTHRGLR